MTISPALTIGVSMFCRCSHTLEASDTQPSLIHSLGMACPASPLANLPSPLPRFHVYRLRLPVPHIPHGRTATFRQTAMALFNSCLFATFAHPRLLEGGRLFHVDV